MNAQTIGTTGHEVIVAPRAAAASRCSRVARAAAPSAGAAAAMEPMPGLEDIAPGDLSFVLAFLRTYSFPGVRPLSTRSERALARKHGPTA
jgi:hypothetical protein